MRKIININQNWSFFNPLKKEQIKVNLPHTWNNIDGQDGGGDYYRGVCTYTYTFKNPLSNKDEELYIEFKGVNSSSTIILNDEQVTSHDGGYSAFRANLTPYLKENNTLVVKVDNSINDYVYPQKADFTFYGGIYRDVNLIIVNKEHFDLDFYGANPLKIDTKINGINGIVKVNAFTKSNLDVTIEIYDNNNKLLATSTNNTEINIDHITLWDGIKNPYLYLAKAKLLKNNEVIDEISSYFGFRTFKVDPKKGFFLNGRPYPLRGVCRHQDRLGLGNAISKKEHLEDMEIIKEIGANTIRLAHYQHDDYIYELCDKMGYIVWAEIPYISEHLKNGDENAISQMKELIYQQYNHPSIVTWGISNEITMFNHHKKDMLRLHHKLNSLCHEIDPNRLTTLACFAMCSPFNKSAHITDIVSWNLYLGWYVPGFFLNDLWIKFFHFLYPNRALGYSEYGAEGMPNLHSFKPKRFDNSEEYQCVYHEYLLKCFERHPYLWATHVWNMFDFGSDGRDQGDDPGKNHKGLVTFDRKLKKDAFYLYKAYWSEEKFIHLCGSRYVNRHEKVTNIKVYSNTNEEVILYHNDQKIATSKADKIHNFKLKLNPGQNKIKVISSSFEDEMIINKVENIDTSYLVKTGNSMSWEKK